MTPGSGPPPGGRRCYRTGVIGHTGRGGYGHDVELACAGLPELDVVAVADPDPAGRAAAARCGAARAYADYREMLAREGLDLVAVATHLLDLMRYFGGEVAWAAAHVTEGDCDATLADRREGDEGIGPVAGDGVAARFAFRGGVAGEFESFVAAGGAGPSAYSLLLHGTRGTIGIRSHPDRQLFRLDSPFLLPGDGVAWRPLLLEGHRPEGPDDRVARYRWAHQVLIRDLLAAAAAGRPPLAGGADARAALEMIMATYEAHLSGRRVAFPLVGRDHPLAVPATVSGSG